MSRKPHPQQTAVDKALLSGGKPFPTAEALGVSRSYVTSRVTRLREQGLLPYYTPRVDPKIKEKIRALHKQGESVTDIAKETGTYDTYVRSVLGLDAESQRESRLRKKPLWSRGKALTLEQREKALALLSSGVTPSQVVKQLRLSCRGSLTHTVRRAIAAGFEFPYMRAHVERRQREETHRVNVERLLQEGFSHSRICEELGVAFSNKFLAEIRADMRKRGVRIPGNSENNRRKTNPNEAEICKLRAAGVPQTEIARSLKITIGEVSGIFYRLRNEDDEKLDQNRRTKLEDDDRELAKQMFLQGENVTNVSLVLDVASRVLRRFRRSLGKQLREQGYCLPYQRSRDRLDRLARESKA